MSDSPESRSDVAVAPEAAPATAPKPAASRRVQFRRSLATMTYDEQVEAVSPDQPTLYTPAHDAAHLVQQRVDPSPPGGPERGHRDPHAGSVEPAVGAVVQKAGGGGDAKPIKAGSWEADVKAFCSQDNIATQKLADVDAEKYLADVSNSAARTGFYEAVGNAINADPDMPKSAVYNRCFNAAAAAYKLKGKKIDIADLGPLMARTQGLTTFFDYHINCKSTYVNASVAMFGAENRDAMLQWFRADCAKKGDVTAMLDKSKVLTPPKGASWFSTDEVKLSGDQGTNFEKLLELNALQPEWFADGTITFKLNKSAFDADNLRKPTAYDGMQSSLWMARNQPGSAFGVTGGGATEFLAGNVKASGVESANASVPSEDLVAVIKKLQEQAQKKALESDPQLAEQIRQAKAELKKIPKDKKDQVKDAEWKIRDLEGRIPNLTDQYIRGAAPSLTAAMGKDAKEALTIVKKVVDSMKLEREYPTPEGGSTHDLSR